MKKKSMKRALSLLTGTASLSSMAVGVVAEEPVETAVSVEAGEQMTYTKVANVRGEFDFDQNIVTPSDKVFSLFGTAATALCAKPGFAFEEPDIANYYINISGNMEKISTLSLSALKESGAETRILKCSCAMGGAIANTQVTGVPLSKVLKLIDLSDDINTVTVKSADGYGIPMPLKVAVDNGAMLVYQIGGEDIPASQGAPVQLWMPQAAARYFTRGVTEIELTHEETVPEIQQPDDAQRAKVSILNHIAEPFAVGDQIIFEGYADDFGTPITAVEFSLDGGETWTACSTEGASADRWVYWYFGYTTEAAGSYKLDVRARTAEGRVSPMAASVRFDVK